jgi:hypothetical protein
MPLLAFAGVSATAVAVFVYRHALTRRLSRR